jgi:hypothetical protein
MSLIRSSSVLLVRSALWPVCAYQDSVADVGFAVMSRTPKAMKSSQKRHKKTAGLPAVLGKIRTFCQVRSELSTAAGAGEPKVAKVKTG